MSKITAEAFEALIRDQLPLAATFAFEVRRLEAGYAEIRLPYRPEFIRPGGTVTGPAIMALADVTMYALVMTVLGRADLAVTTHLNTSFLRRPAQRPLMAQGRLLKMGRRLAFGDVPIFSEDDPEPVAHAVVTYSIPPDAKMP